MNITEFSDNSHKLNEHDPKQLRKIVLDLI